MNFLKYIYILAVIILGKTSLALGVQYCTSIFTHTHRHLFSSVNIYIYLGNHIYSKLFLCGIFFFFIIQNHSPGVAVG